MDFLKTIAPWIFNALTGNVVGLAGLAASTVASKLGLADSSVDAVKTALSGITDPKDLLALKQADNAFAIQMKQLGFQHEEQMAGLEFKDTDSARNRQVALKDKMPDYIAGVVVIATFVLEGMLMFHALPTNVDGVILGRVLGTLDAALILVLQFYFGSSRSSQKAQDAAVDIGKAAAGASITVNSPDTNSASTAPTTSTVADNTPSSNLYKGS